MNTRVAGIDGCKKGWIVCEFKNDLPTLYFIHRLEELDGRDFAAILIDMPLGFAFDVYRKSEIEARYLLKNRRSSIFFSPTVQAFQANDYPVSSSINRQLIGKGLSKQVFNLFPKIKEAISFKDKNPHSVFESHPELCFLGWKGSPAVYSKKTQEGVQERLNLIKDLSVETYNLYNKHSLKVSNDDVLDAMIMGLTAKEHSHLTCLGNVKEGQIVYFESPTR